MALRPDDKGAVLAGGHGLLQYFENVAKTTVPIVLAEQRKAAIRRRPARDALVQDGYDWLQHGHILSADFSPDGRFFATGDIYGNIHHWAVAGIGGEPVIVDQSGKAKVWSLAYSSNGRVLAAGYEGEIRFYALGDGSMRRVAQFTLPEKSGVIRRIVAGRDPDVFFAAVDEHGVIRLQLKDTTVRNETLLESGDHVWALARSGVSEDMLAASSGSTLWLLTPSATVDGGWEKRALSSGVGFVASAAWSADGRVLAAGFDDGSIRLWRSERLDDLPVTVRTEGGYVRAIALSSNGAFLVAGGDDAHLRYFPLDVRAAAESVCGTVMRNLTRSEWKDFVGEALAYEATCPGIPGSVPVD